VELFKKLVYFFTRREKVQAGLIVLLILVGAGFEGLGTIPL
jgi:hypothetical protein